MYPMIGRPLSAPFFQVKTIDVAVTPFPNTPAGGPGGPEKKTNKLNWLCKTKQGTVRQQYQYP